MTSSFGSWPSPFTAAQIAQAAPRIDGALFVGDEIWWGESVPSEGGRITVRSSTGAEILPAPWNARSRVHEYGGGSWTADDEGTLFFVDGSDQRVYRMPSSGDPEPLTAPGAAYGGLRAQHGRLLAVREDLRPQPHRRAIVEIPVDGSAATDDDAVRVVVSTTGFVAHPALSPDGSRIAWVQWSTEHMPWELALLHVAPVNVAPVHGDAMVSVSTRAALQPEWVGDGELLYLDDPSGRWNLQRVRVDESAAAPTPVAPADADTGGGLWVLGNRWYRPLDDGSIVAVRTNGDDRIVQIGTDGNATQLDVPITAGASIDDVRGSQVLVSGAGATVGAGLWCLDLDRGTVTTITGGADADPDWVPQARPVTFDGPHGPVHAFDYPPTHPDARAPHGELPPYVVMVHGGPTAHVSGAASTAYAYWTSRGIGVLDVNYGGSTGYGRAYRERLDGAWGVVDVDDVIAAARGLADEGLADPARIAIRGGSAGGWTVLSALVRGGTFGAGISRYGVADLRMLAAETHDFEARYLDGLVGPLPEAESVYIERSPLTHAARIDVPVLLEQGSEDRVVPPSQSEAIRDALAARGVPHEYVLFEGEGHGFRAAETIIASLETELRFLGRAFDFEPRLGA
ncbi:prolyl oligopeptidase family serine peptidase [Microbacterium esteraromaticum]|uniref:S9 family peptidase n=1 Tax=Microbacterium esteraromaticum TaxID=57043 RepID=UPI001C9744C1|nr:prolyl oligopeptidase family serine peptidase [Microbacterium esteraromaticum]MBY6062542.1 prolyl oligopeptidase family serine peptidase [Microbacterium esteraromaticum]